MSNGRCWCRLFHRHPRTVVRARSTCVRWSMPSSTSTGPAVRGECCLANVDDAQGAKAVLSQLLEQDFPRLEVLWGDHKYHNYELEEWLDENAPFTMEVVTR